MFQQKKTDTKSNQNKMSRKRELKQQMKRIRKSGLFDGKWYLRVYPDVKEAGADPLKHYIKFGWKEGRNPNPDFNTSVYVKQHPEVEKTGINPLLHYINNGAPLRKKRTWWQRLFHRGNSDYRLLKKSKFFDSRWYLKTYPDVKKAHLNPIKHYLFSGWKEGRNPSPEFNGEEYLNINPDVRAAGVNPLVHYLRVRKKENRQFKLKEPILASPAAESYFCRVHADRKGIKRILLVSHELTYTGAPLSLLKSAELLIQMGYQVKTVSLKQGELGRKFKAYGPVYMLRDTNDLVRKAADCDFAIVNTVVCYAEYAALKHLLPTVWWLREPGSMLDMYRYQYAKTVLQTAEYVYAMSDMSRQEFLPYNADIMVMKHGLDDEWRRKDINTQKPVFAVIGSIDERKGQDIFAEAIRLLSPSERSKARFCIVGKTHNKNFLKSLNKGIETSLEILDPITDHAEMLSFYEKLSCAVIPSREEPTSRIAIEAMMMGRPVLMSDRVGAQYLMNGKNGDVFKNEDAKALAELMKKIINRPEKLKQMSVAARKAYEENNSIAVYQKNLKKMLEDVAVAKPAPNKLLVHLHLYYHEQVDYFIQKLKNITCDYDLWVTYVTEDEDSKEKLRALKPDTQFLLVSNRGYDVYPFIRVIQRVDLTQYGYVLKIHTKNYRENRWNKDGILYVGYQWRDDLINPLIGNKAIFKRNIKLFERYPTIGMIGSRNLLRRRESSVQIENTKQLCHRLNTPYSEQWFFTGTMFMIRSDILRILQQHHFSDDDFASESYTGCVGSLAHSIGTFFGIATYNQQYGVRGVDTCKTWYRRQISYLRKVYSLFNKPKRYRSNKKYIRKSKYFSKKWYLKKYPDVAAAKVNPIKHYLNIGWKEGRDPSPFFSTRWYLDKYKDVRDAGVNPLLHYERNGKYEGRVPTWKEMPPSNLFVYPMWLWKERKRLSQKSVGQCELPLIVSLTTYPQRIYAVIETIRSLLAQTQRPDKIILWLSYEEFPRQEKELPKELLALRKTGLTIDWCHNMKSYNKLLPALEKYPKALHITVDDDIIYEPTMIEKLYNSYLKYPNDIHCHRVTKFYWRNGYKAVTAYNEYYQDGSYLNKLTGVGGVLYPVGCFGQDVLNTKLIRELAPTNDDQWFWFQSVLKGVKTRVVEGASSALTYVDGSQETGLYLMNDKGPNLFWRDFKRLIAYYPDVDQKLRQELKQRSRPNIRVILKAWLSLGSNVMWYRRYRKNLEQNIKDTRYYESLPPEAYPKELSEWYHKMTGHVLNLENPQTFNEKIQWLKLYDSTPLKSQLADKYLVREWVKKEIGEQYLIPLLGVYDKFEDIDFSQLPERFVIKCNHGSGWNIIVKDKSKLDLASVKVKLDRWMKSNFAFQMGFELNYKSIKPKIIIEQFIENEGTDDLYDYKFWCFNGKVKYIQFLSERNQGGLKMAFYDPKWNKQSFVYDHPLDQKNMEKPSNLEEMIRIVKKLSKGFCHVRVDLYRLNDGQIYFGEMTFSSMSGVGHWNDEMINLELGRMITLPTRIYDLSTHKYIPVLSQKKKPVE